MNSMFEVCIIVAFRVQGFLSLGTYDEKISYLDGRQVDFSQLITILLCIVWKEKNQNFITLQG